MGDIPDFPIEEDELKQPAEPQPIYYFGPSSLTVVRTGAKDDRRTCYTASLFVGGLGRALDGRWGQNFQFSFEAPDSQQVMPVPAAAALMLDKYRSTIAKGWGEQSADIIIHALGQIVQGRHFPNQMTAEQYMEAMF